MPRPPCPRPTAPLTRAELTLLADHLLGLHHDLDDALLGPALVRARRAGEGIDLAVRPLPRGTHPAEVLLGHVVPARWAAAGVVVPATARTLLPQGAASPRPVTVALLVGRDGVVVGPARAPDGASEVDADAAPEGLLVDLVLRSLRLPTPPPQVPTRRLWEALWLDAVVAGAARPDATPTLDRSLADALADAAPEGPRGWGHLRALAASPASARSATDAALARALHSLIDPADAAWMDDGCFARWTLGELPSTDDLLEAVDALLDPEPARAVRCALGLAATSPGPSPGAPDGG